MNITITPAPLSGSLAVPASKSMSHRMVIGAALAEGESVISNLSLSEDITATLQAVKALGAAFTVTGEQVVIHGAGGKSGAQNPLLDCGESGSTLRFLIPVALALTGEASFTGRGRLMERPLDPYFALFAQKGISCRREGQILTVRGSLSGGEFPLSGAVSSQFITGLLFALPLLGENSEMIITDKLSSRAYVDMTISALRVFGVSVENESYARFRIPGGQRFTPCRTAVEGDWSQAAFFLAANAIGSSVTLTGLRADSLQGDRAAEKILRHFQLPGEVSVDADEIPDLIPALAAAAAFRDGQTTYFINAGRLRAKESDRIAATVSMLRALGAEAEGNADSIIVHGSASLPGDRAPVDCQNDHRIAMAAAAASVGCKHSVRLLGAECVKKSYPRFWDDFRALGGKAIDNEQ